jgi:hypothetical protein
MSRNAVDATIEIIHNGEADTEIERICSAIVQRHIAVALTKMPWLMRK